MVASHLLAAFDDVGHAGLRLVPPTVRRFWRGPVGRRRGPLPPPVLKGVSAGLGSTFRRARAGGFPPGPDLSDADLQGAQAAWRQTASPLATFGRRPIRLGLTSAAVLGARLLLNLPRRATPSGRLVQGPGWHVSAGSAGKPSVPCLQGRSLPSSAVTWAVAQSGGGYDLSSNIVAGGPIPHLTVAL